MALAGTNLEHARSYNRRVVVETVRTSGAISRAEIARATGLSAQTVSNIAEELLGAGLLVASGRRTGGRGQPPIELAINPGGGFTIGLSLDHRRLVAVLVDLAGERRAEVEIATAAPTPAAALPLMADAVARLRRAGRVEGARILGAGVVMPTLFEAGSPVSFGPTSLPAWDGFPLTERLSALLEMPVLVENDATAAAVGERLYGAGRDLRDFVYVYFGVGLGAGIITGGQPHRGAGGRAGELGHMVVVPGGRPCLCGNHGCLERYVSLAAAHAAVAGPDADASDIDPARLEAAFLAGEPTLDAWLSDAAGHFRAALANIENLLDPETVILGGLLPPAMRRTFLARLEPLPPSVAARPGRAMPRLIEAGLGPETPALGAAALPLFHRLAPRLATGAAGGASAFDF
ncbi:putative NBD/HSP70 family sugar kinase [Stella humosa]|uniref:Putative NBD/HSP70 family sugar kinase n=1 Tax=Stella humosa TaxID=94 RepID=A0A3N1KPH5_9PROT|nr:ROK family transcriptional regulator [Stella humosa]ROP81247.1 putative NBD/HSP70 family sugar kinase [Stella humosa]BBK32595.1 sugar kinase [Stella humosa]